MERWVWPGLACFASTLALGSRYWTMSYHDLQLPGALPLWALLLMLVFTVVLRAATDTAWWLVFLAGALPVPIVICARIAVEINIDPTSHNLFPFEVVIGLVVGAFFGGLGLGIGELIRLASRSLRVGSAA
jgi:hypothetical protein